MTTHIKHSLGLWAGLLLAAVTATGQEAVTKSGTPVVPADRVAAAPAEVAKNRSPLPDLTAGTYLVATREDLLPALAPLLQWKREQGYRVETLVMPSRESDSLRAALQARWEQSSPLRPGQKYVLLVGDVDRLQACAGRYTPGGLANNITDLYYGEYTGDYVPEALVGRLSVTDSAQLRDVAAKIIAYEQGRWAAAERLVLTAGREERANAPTTTNGQVNYLAQLAAEYRPELETVVFHNPASGDQLDSLVRALDHANVLVNYTAHCTSLGWSSPNLTHSTFDTLPQAVPTVFVNNCCLSNSFQATCLGEQLLRKADGGAVGVIGATNETLWNEDYYWAVGAKYPPQLHPVYENDRPGAFDPLLTGLPDGASLGALNYAGCSAVTLAGSPYDAFYWETYCLLGDPSMTLMMGSTDSLTLSLTESLTESLTAGQTEIAVAGSPLCRISATQPGRLLGTTVTDSNGLGLLPLAQGLTGDSLTLTATRPESICRQAILPIAAPAHGTLAVTHAEVEGNALVLTLHNVGNGQADGHRLTLTQDSRDSNCGTALDAQPLQAALPSLPSRADTTLRLPLGNGSIGPLPLIQCRLTLYDGADSAYSTLPLTLETEDLRPQLTGLQLLDTDGRPLRRLVPGSVCQVCATLAHEADSARLTINHRPATTELNSDQLITLFAPDSSEVHYHLSLDVHKDRWHECYAGWLLAHNNMEDFESGDLSNYPWQSNNLYPWVLDSSQAHGGRFSARSAAIADGQRTTLTLEIETLTDDSIAFYYNVSSEGSDWLYFYLDGRRRGYWSGNSGWQYYARALPAGKHTLQWFYQKDASGSEREDCARIDDIRLPLALWPQPYGHSVAEEEELGMAENPEPGAWLSLAPNPAAGRVTLSHNARPYARKLTLYDAYGRMADEIIIEDNCTSTQYLTHHLRFGVYTLVLQDHDGSLVRKLIVTRQTHAAN